MLDPHVSFGDTGVTFWFPKKLAFFPSKKQAKIQKYGSKFWKKISRDTFANPLPPPSVICWHYPVTPSPENVTYHLNDLIVHAT